MVASPPPPVELIPVLRQLAELRPILRQLVDRLDDQGDKAVRRAFELAARGYPASTNGNEGGRSSDSTSSTERAALNPSRFDDIDGRLSAHLRMCAYFAKLTHDNLNVIMSQGSDEDYVRPGTGKCQVEGCEHICNPEKNQHDRLKLGRFCPRCYKRWDRWGRPDKDWFERHGTTEDVA